MSPVSRSRKPKRPHKHVQHAPASPYAKFLEEAKALLDPETDVVEAELWGSFALGALFETSWFGEDEADEEDPDDVFEEQFGELLDYFGKQKRRPEALAGLRALAMVGEEWTREEALRTADELAAAGVKEPGWLRRAHEVEPTSVFRAGDLFGDAGTINLGFRRGGEEHTVSCYVSDRGGPVLERVLVVPGGAAELAEGMRANEEGEAKLYISELTPVQARTLLAEALDRLLSEGPEDPEELLAIAEEAGLDPEELEMTSPVGLWALLSARLELLPEPDVSDTAVGSAEDVRETVEAFLASKQAAELADPELAGALATVFADVAALSDRTAVGFGPISLGGYLLDEFAETIELTEVEAMLVPAVLTAWAEFTNERRGFGEEGLRLWREALPELTRAFTQVYLDDEVAGLREEYEAIPVRDYKVNAGMDLSEVLQQLVDEARGTEQEDDEDADEYVFDVEDDEGDEE
ncbi:hypothetical protein KDK95_27350 [Actinospica sp. MGRD01-02]|uniref:Uncharacterized protein n=1 Tax=Actinospica acidithermotolerans TaxID=2828514 RepID=A0A941EJ58_9ACTN|nr:hypothetical protein [Actinospica acidithermotolerans]MBR7830049.1 hypothetical protein [Actinospica acidithermotolerans]